MSGRLQVPLRLWRYMAPEQRVATLRRHGPLDVIDSHGNRHSSWSLGG